MSLFKEIVCLFESLIVNRPEGLLDGAFTKKGRIEHHFIALESISIVFMEVKKTLVDGRDGLNMKAQVLAECAACDYANHKAGYWVPILAILCDGNNFEYLVYDSSDRAVHNSGRIPGIVFAQRGDQVDFLYALKQSTEYLFDWFIMTYINGIRAFGDGSMKCSRTSHLSLTIRRFLAYSGYIISLLALFGVGSTRSIGSYGL